MMETERQKNDDMIGDKSLRLKNGLSNPFPNFTSLLRGSTESNNIKSYQLKKEIWKINIFQFIVPTIHSPVHYF